MSDNFEVAKLENSFQLPSIKFDKELLQTYVNEKVEKYKNLVFEEEQLQEAKKDVTALNKISKEINDWAIKVDKEISAPVKQFREEVKAISSGLKEVAEKINKQVATFEEKRAAENRKKVIEIIDKVKSERSFTGDLVYNEKWFNVSTAQKLIKEEVNKQIDEAIEAEKNRMIAEQARKERIEAIENHVNLLNEKYQLGYKFTVSRFLAPIFVNLENSLQEVLASITKEFEIEYQRLEKFKEQENAEEQRKQEQEKKSVQVEHKQANVEPPQQEPVEEIFSKTIQLTYKQKHKSLLKELFEELQKNGVHVKMI